MATITSHTLDGVQGLHAGNIPVSLRRLDPDGTSVAVFALATDSGGRFSATVEVLPEHAGAKYEMVFEIAGYFAAQAIPAPGLRLVDEIVVRFAMPDPDGRYHIPVILSPNSCSAWWSS